MHIFSQVAHEKKVFFFLLAQTLHQRMLLIHAVSVTKDPLRFDGIYLKQSAQYFFHNIHIMQSMQISNLSWFAREPFDKIPETHLLFFFLETHAMLSQRLQILIRNFQLFFENKSCTPHPESTMLPLNPDWIQEI